MDAKSIERVVRGAVSTVLTRIVNDSRSGLTSTNGADDSPGDNSESSEDYQRRPAATQVQVSKKKRFVYIHTSYNIATYIATYF